MPEVGEPDSLSQDEPGHQEYSRNAKNVSGKSVVFQRGVGTNEGWASFIDFFRLSCGIAERNASHVNVRVGISPDQIEEASAATASVNAGGSELGAACLRVADQKFD